MGIMLLYVKIIQQSWVNNLEEMTVESVVNKLFDQICRKLDNTQAPLLVIIGGVPGAGKTTITNLLRGKLNDYLKENVGFPLNEHYNEDMVTEKNILHEIAVMYTTDKQLIQNELTYSHSIVNYNTYTQSLTDRCLSVRSIGGYDTSFELESGIETHDVDFISTIPMDGFHVPMSVLTQYKDSPEFIAKRGHYTTFDSKNYIEFVRVLCLIISKCMAYNKEDQQIGFKLRYPGFDHAVGDPRANAYQLNIQSQGLMNPRVIILEGLYNLFDESNYGKDIAETIKKYNIPHVSYFIDSTDAELEERVSKRHLESGLVKSLEEGIVRFRNNDLKNGRLVRDNLIKDKDLVVINNDT